MTNTLTLCLGYGKEELLTALTCALDLEQDQDAVYVILAYCNDPRVVQSLKVFHLASMEEDPNYLHKRKTFRFKEEEKL